MDPFPHEIFRCPLTGASLRPATTTELAEFNGNKAGTVPLALGDGTTVEYPWKGAWRTTTEPTIWYPICDGIPVLTPDAGTPGATT